MMLPKPNNIQADKYVDNTWLWVGSNFELICKAFIKKNDEVIVPEFSFIIYRIYSKIYGAKVRFAKEKILLFR